MSNDAEKAQAETQNEESIAEAAVDSAVEDASAADNEVAKLEAKVEENWNLYVRAAAELENVRKRAVRDVENARKYALENFGRELLSVVDSFEMGLAAVDQADAATLKEGSEATLKQLKAALERFGIQQIEADGQPFDPELHEAISMQPSSDVEPNSVLAAVQTGYTLNGRLLRPARVVVSTAPENTAESSQ